MRGRLPTFAAVFVALAAAVLAPATLAQERPDDYAAVAPLTLAAPEGLQRLHLTLPVLRASRSEGLSDLRLFNGKGESLPYSLVPPQAGQAARTAALPLFPWPMPPAADPRGAALHVQLDERGAVLRVDTPRGPGSASPTAWLVDASGRAEGERLEALTLDWAPSATGLARRLQVEGSDDLEHWRPLGESALVDLPGSGVQPRVLRAAWEPQPALQAPRYLRLRLDETLALRGVRARWTKNEPPVADSASVAFARVRDETPAAWEADLEAPLPLRRLTVSLPQPNTVVVLAVEQRQGETGPWRPVARQTVYRLTHKGRELVSPPIELDAPSARYWRLRLTPGGPGLDTPSLQADVAWPAVWLAFAARAPQPVKLAVGRERTPPASLALQTLLPAQRPQAELPQLPQAALGALQVQAAVEPSLSQRWRDAGPAERRRWALWAVLVAAVAGLGVLARGLWKDVQRRD